MSRPRYLIWFYKYPTICICGANLGTGHIGFRERKRKHFMARHPRSYAQGRIA